ncbi:MAG: DUF1007 family protein [Rhizobiales bacterium]|nr:DUF1007 family protein [Hyphomicrobiales bacterium]
MRGRKTGVIALDVGKAFAGATSLRHWLLTLAVAIGGACLAAAGARAHPHVWVTMRATIVYAPDGAVTGVSQDWTFDDMYSAFALTGIEAQKKGHYTRAELQPLAQVNIDSLKDFGYFTFAKLDGKRRQGDAFAAPVDYWLDYDSETAELTLHFTLPFKQPTAAKHLIVEIYDPEFFIDFAFAENDAVKLIGAPTQCKFSAEKPQDDNFFSAQRLNRSYVPSEANIGMGMKFANKISVECP